MCQKYVGSFFSNICSELSSLALDFSLVSVVLGLSEGLRTCPGKLVLAGIN